MFKPTQEKMKVMLVMPRTGYLWDEWSTPPVGIAYISAYLKKNGKDVVSVNLNLEDGSVYDILKKYIEEYDIDILGTGELVVNYQKLQEIARCARKIKPQLKIWIGGGLVTNSPVEAMKLIPEADFGMIGEGEITSLELVNLFEKKGLHASFDEIKEIDGLILNKNNNFYSTEKRKEIVDLDTLPFPDWEGFCLVETCKKYSKDNSGIVASVVSSRSCPNSCTFCSKSGGKRYRKRSIENIFDEIDELVNKYGVTRINFNDELFADSSDRLFRFCDMIAKYKIQYRVSMHIGKNLTLELLTRMYKSGCEVIFYGLESADNNVLKSMRKHITIEEIERCLKITKQAGIAVEGNFIFGDPEETVETVKTTIAWIIKNFSLGLFEVAPIKLYPGSQLYEDAIKSGKINDSVQFISGGCPLINVSKLKDNEYQKMINYDLTVVQKMRLIEQEGIGIHKTERGALVEYSCPNCKKIIRFEFNDMSHFLRMYTKHCDECGTLEYLNLFPIYYSKIKNKIESLLKTKRVGIFGCGNIWKMFYSVGEVFQNNKYTIIDETPYLQSNGWNNKEVISPRLIIDRKIDVILIMIRSSEKEIREKLKNEYELVNLEIIMCYDLL